MHIIDLGFEQFDISIGDINSIGQLMHNIIVAIVRDDPATEIADGGADLEHNHEQQTGRGEYDPDDQIHPLNTRIAPLIDGAGVVLAVHHFWI